MEGEIAEKLLDAEDGCAEEGLVEIEFVEVPDAPVELSLEVPVLEMGEVPDEVEKWDVDVTFIAPETMALRVAC